MANVGIYIRISDERIAKLDRIAAGQPFGASRAAVLTGLAEKAIDDVPEDARDVERLRAAMASAKLLGPSKVDDAAGVSHGTTRNVLVGAKLASAGGGALLAWVEQQEASGVTP